MKLHSKHIVFIDDAFTFGGAQIALCNALEVLSNRGGVRLTAIISNSNKMLEGRVSQIPGVRIIECPASYPVNIVLFFFRLQEFARIFRLAELSDVDYWIINLSGIEFGLASVFLLRKKKKYIYGWLHNTQQLAKLMSKASLIKRYFYFVRDAIADRLILREYNKLLVPSQSAKQTLLLRVNRLLSVHVLYNFHNISANKLIKSNDMMFGLPFRNHLMVAVVGRIEFTTKGQDRVVEIALSLQQRGLNPFFLFIGDGADRLALQQAFIKANLRENYFITGWQEDSSGWINAASVVLIPSRFEAFSLVAAEAMALKKKVIASALPCFNEVLPPVCIANSNSAKDFADAIIHVLALDEDELAKLYAPYLEKFTPSAFLRNFDELLDNEVDCVS